MRRCLVCLALVLFLVGCQAEDKGAVAIATNPFIGGTEGVVHDFQDFRDEVFDGGNDPFDVVVRLENKGETRVDAADVQVKLSGINYAEFDKTAEDLIRNAPDDIIDRRKDPQGNIIPPPLGFVEFTDLNYEGSITGSRAEFPLRAELCYVYRTKAVSKLCVRENLLTPRPGGICEISEDKTVFNSGAPVQITQFKEATRSRDKLGFTFEVSNVGTGNVYQRNTKCDKSVRKNENRVYVIVNTGISDLKCTGLDDTNAEGGVEGFVTMFGGSKIVSCSQEITSKSDFEQLVNIEVIYDYEEIKQTTLAVLTSGE